MNSWPNILHIFTDQQRWDTIAALGNPVIKTPHLDRLCEEGVAFTSAYSPCPVCVPARASMVHGLYPHTTGFYENCCGVDRKVQDRQTFMHALTEAGYRTHGVGKCHFMPDALALRGFQTRERQEGGGKYRTEHNDYAQWLISEGVGLTVDDTAGAGSEMYYIPQPCTVEQKYHPSQWVGDRSVAFINEQAKEDGPWYLFSSYLHPHPPFTPPYPWNHLYRAFDMPLPFVPPDSETLWTFVNRVQNRYKGRSQGIDQNLFRCMIAYYYACISFVDYQVGRLLETLEQTGQIDNTLILFTVDHGDFMGDYNCVGKRSWLDPAAHIPMIVRQPGRFEGGYVCDTPVSLVDVAPTFCAAAGAEVTSHPLHGEDLAAVLSGESNREMIFGQHAYTWPVHLGKSRYVPRFEDRVTEVASKASYMALNDRWKYYYSAGDNREFLFDRRLDPMETRNRANIAQFKDIQKQMRDATIAHLREFGETAGIEGDDWKKFPSCGLDVNPDAAAFIDQAEPNLPEFVPEEYLD